MRKKNCLIFIVEDDTLCGKLIEYYLRRNGYTNIVLFTSERAFLNELRQHPRIVITGNRLKSMNGVELIQYAREIYSDFYCILFSGMSYDEIYKDETAELCIDKYIRKGLSSIDDLLLEVNSWRYKRYVEQLL